MRATVETNSLNGSTNLEQRRIRIEISFFKKNIFFFLKRFTLAFFQMAYSSNAFKI